MARFTGVALAAVVLSILAPRPAAALETTLLFGRVAGGELGGFGYQVRNAGDLNGDGVPDIVVGAPFDSTRGLNAGRAFVWFGGSELTGEPDLILEPANGGDYFGFAVAGVGDVDGDGFDDLAIGAPRALRGGGRLGAVYLYRGGTNMNAGVDAELEGEVGNDRFGWSIAPAGDMDRDNTDDFVVGAPYNNLDGSGVGRAYLFVGQGSMSSIGPAADVIFSGEPSGGPTNSTNFAKFAPDGVAINGPGFGFSVASVEDFRGDGRACVAVGAPGALGATGRVYLYFAASTSGQLPSASPSVTVTNNTSNEEFGWSVAGGGFVNTGSQADLLVGAPGTSGSRGSVHVYYGASSPPAVISSSSLERFQGVATYRFGFSVAGAGDAEGSNNNWLVGAPADAVAGINAGRVYLYRGTSSTPTVLVPENAGGAPLAEDQWGFSLDGLLGDLGGDGLDDFIIGAPTGNAPDNAVRGVLALVSSGSRVVATPTARLDAVRRYGSVVEISFSGTTLGAADDAVLYAEGRSRQLARLGAGIWPDARGLVAQVELSELATDIVELSWTVDGFAATASFELPAFRAVQPSLLPPVPNPFNPRTTLSVDMPEAGSVRLRIVDLRGRTVRELYNGNLQAGVTPLVFDGTDDGGRRLASGGYVAVLEAGDRRDTRRLTLVQ
jgi:hypothetical protein